MKCKRLLALLLSLCMIASLFVAMPITAATNTINVVDINLPLDDANELTWVASSSVTVSNADGIGERDKVVLASGLANSNNNTVGVKLPDGFAFQEGDVLTYSLDVYSATAINPDMWLRNHGSSLNPFATLHESAITASEWTTITKTYTFEELEAKIATSNSSGSFATADNYAFYLRPRTNADVYLDNLKLTVARPVADDNDDSTSGDEANPNAVINITVEDASDITWTNGGTAADANGIGGRDGVVELGNLANANGNTAGVVLADSFAFQEGDIITYSFDVYSDTITNPDIWIRNHGSGLEPFATFYHTSTAGEWTPITKTLTYAELVTAAGDHVGNGWNTADKYALYIRPRQSGTVYIDNFTVTVEREGGASDDSGDSEETTDGFTVEPWPYVTDEGNGVYKVTTADIVANETEGAASSQVRLRIIPNTPISTDANIKISFDFTSEGILNSKGSEYDSLPVNLRLFDSVDGTKQANTIGYVKNGAVVANTGEAVSVTYNIADMENGGGTSTLTDIASIGVQVDMYGAYKQYVTAANDGYFTISNIKIEEVVEEPETPPVTFDYSKYETTILTGTDFQAENNEVGAQNVTNIIGAIEASGLQGADAFLFCGDYENTSGQATTEGINALKEAVVDFVPDTDSHIYVQGNHDAALGTPGLTASGNNDPATGDYGVFVINEDDYGCTNDLGKVMRTADNLASYLNAKLAAGYDKPVFVLSHVPLYYSTRTLNDANAKFADQIFHVLNQAGEQGLEIIFLAGHDHSRAYESYLGGAAVYLAKGDKINIAQSSVINFKEETLNFTYMNAGYVGYYNEGNGADNVINMLVIGIDEDTDTVDIYRFDKNGLHNLKSAGKLLDGEADLYTANTTVYTSPQTIASTSVNYEKEITTLPAVSTNGEKVVDINLLIDDASEITWTGSSAVTVSNADGIGGRDNVVKAEGLADNNNNTVGVKIADNFAFQEGDVISFSFDVYSETAINPDIWIRNHGSSLTPFDPIYNSPIATNTWTTVAGIMDFVELNNEYDWTTVGDYKIYLRPRQDATVYLDNIKVTVTRVVEERGNIINIEVNDASDITWTASEAVTVSDANAIGGRDGVIELGNLANSNTNTAGVILSDAFAFEEGDILTYSLDVYSNSAINPDIWVRNHGTSLSPFLTLYNTPIKANEWTTITRSVTYAELIAAGAFNSEDKYALYVRLRDTQTATVYVDNFTVTVSRLGYEEPGTGGTTPGAGETDPDEPVIPNECEHEVGTWEPDDEENHKGTCSKCNEEVTEAHTWDDGDITTPPTVDTEGVKTYTCTVCGETKTEAIDKISVRGDIIKIDAPLDAVKELDWIASSAVTVTKVDGISGRNNVLKVEGLANSNNNTAGIRLTEDFAFQAGDILTYSVDVYSETAINPDIWLRNHENTVNPGTFVTFYEQQMAANAWKTVTQTFTFDELEAKIASSNSSGSFATQGDYMLYIRPRGGSVVYLDNFKVTVSRDGYCAHENNTWETAGEDSHTATCTLCGEVRENLPHTWDDGEITTEPTCTTAGEKKVTCTACGETKTEVVSVSHEWDEGEITTAATCTTAGAKLFTCSLCGETETKVIPALGHKWDEGKITKDATCTEAGVKTFTCSGCDGTYTEDIQALGHSWDAGVDETLKTCTTDGVKKFTCSTCNETETKVISAGHTWDDGIVTKAVSCTEDGEKLFTCSACDATETEVIKSEGHKYDEEITKEATCEEAGEKKFTCSVCDDSYTEVIPFSHEWSAGATTKEPTYTEEGIKEYTCTKCGGTKTEPIFKLGQNIIEIVAPLDKVSELTWVASDDVTVTEANRIGGKDNVLKIEGLAYDNKKTAGIKLPDGFAFQAGDILTYSVDVYSSSAINPDIWLRNHDSSLNPYAILSENIITASTWTTITSTYTFEELEAINAKNKDSAGSFADVGNYAVYIRPREGQEGATVYLDNFKIEVSRSGYCAHKEGTWVTDGAETHTGTCTVCGKTLEKVSHIWDNGVVTTPKTCTTDGEKTFTCVCGETKKELIPAGHEWNDGEETNAPTCTTEGKNKFTCTLCGEIEEEKIPALGHKFDDGEANTAAGTKVYTCTVCQEKNVTVEKDIVFEEEKMETSKIDEYSFDQPLDEKSELDHVGKNVKSLITEVDGIGGRNGVLKVEKMKNANDNAVGRVFARNFAVQPGDVIEYSIDVYAEAAINPDIWIRNGSTEPFMTVYHDLIAPGVWTTVTKKVEYKDLIKGTGDWNTVGNFIVSLRPRTDGNQNDKDDPEVTVYLDNFKVNFVGGKRIEELKVDSYDTKVTQSIDSAKILVTFDNFVMDTEAIKNACSIKGRENDAGIEISVEGVENSNKSVMVTVKGLASSTKYELVINKSGKLTDTTTIPFETLGEATVSTTEYTVGSDIPYTVTNYDTTTKTIYTVLLHCKGHKVIGKYAKSHVVSAGSSANGTWMTSAVTPDFADGEYFKLFAWEVVGNVVTSLANGQIINN